MVAAMTLFGEVWEMAEPPLEVELDEDGEPDVWHAQLGSWQESDLAPRDRPVDLFVATFELCGEVVKGCWWNDRVAIPDWYTRDENGNAVLAAKPWQWVNFWKIRDAPEGPLEDGGPGLNARINLPDDPIYFVGSLKERYDRYAALKEAA